MCIRDSVAGVPFLILEANYVTKRKRPLTIVGPPGLKTRFPEVMEGGFPGTGTMALNFPLHLVELEIGKRREIGAVGVTPFHVVHDDRAGPCLGFRFEIEDKVIAFSGDTESVSYTHLDVYKRQSLDWAHVAVRELEPRARKRVRELVRMRCV